MPRARRDGNRVAHTHFVFLTPNAYAPGAVRDLIYLLGRRMIMLGRRSARRNARLRQALIGNRRIPMRQQLPDFRPILGRKRRYRVEILHIHHSQGGTASTSSHFTKHGRRGSRPSPPTVGVFIPNGKILFPSSPHKLACEADSRYCEA